MVEDIECFESIALSPTEYKASAVTEADGVDTIEVLLILIDCDDLRLPEIEQSYAGVVTPRRERR